MWLNQFHGAYCAFELSISFKTSRSERRPHVDVYVHLPAGEQRVQGSGSCVDKHKAERY